jgi:hypothetical protein
MVERRPANTETSRCNLSRSCELSFKEKRPSCRVCLRHVTRHGWLDGSDVIIHHRSSCILQYKSSAQRLRDFFDLSATRITES